MKNIYLEVDENNNVTAITEDETPILYGEVEDDVELEDIVTFLELDKHPAKWENEALVLIVEEHEEEELVTVSTMEMKIAEAVTDTLEAVSQMLQG